MPDKPHKASGYRREFVELAQAHVFLQLDFQENVRMTAAVRQPPDGAVVTSTRDFAPGRRLVDVGTILVQSGEEPLVINAFRAIRLTFSPIP